MENTIAPGIDTTRSSIDGRSSGGARAAADLNFDTFLRLLTTQLRNQDPLNPLDGTEFTAQIASFSALEQQIATNTNLEKLLLNQSYSQQSTAIGLIGQEVLAAGNIGTLDNGELEFSYTQEKDSIETIIEIFDASGVRVAALVGSTYAGQHSGLWDGKSVDGVEQPDGQYLLRVTAVGEDGEPIETQARTFQRVIGVRSEDSGVFLEFENGAGVELSTVFTVRRPVERPTPQTPVNGGGATSNGGGNTTPDDGQTQPGETAAG